MTEPLAERATEQPDCKYEDGPAIARARWTVYGGGSKAALVCTYHRSVVAGQRGVDITPLCPGCWRPVVDATGDWQCHRCQRLWPASFFDTAPIDARTIVPDDALRPETRQR